MSKKKVRNALLEGYRVPTFPGILEKLREAQGSTRTTDLELEKLAKKQIRGVDTKFWPQTSDGYKWFFSICCNFPQSRIAILFPWSNDLKARNGDTHDRSIAVYTQGQIGRRYINVVINELIKAMQN